MLFAWCHVDGGIVGLASGMIERCGGVWMTDENIRGKRSIVLLTGATGYVGGRLLDRLQRLPVRLRCIARHPEKLNERLTGPTEVVQGDILDRFSLDAALAGVDTAYYLVHFLSGSSDFARDDRRAAVNFA